jgi:hypothetical protein
LISNTYTKFDNAVMALLGKYSLAFALGMLASFVVMMVISH